MIMMTMMMMMVKPVLAIELRAIPPQSTPQPHLLHRPDNDDAEVVDDDENVDGDVDEDNDDVDVDEDDDEPAKQLDHRTVQPLYTRR